MGASQNFPDEHSRKGDIHRVLGPARGLEGTVFPRHGFANIAKLIHGYFPPPPARPAVWMAVTILLYPVHRQKFLDNSMFLIPPFDFLLPDVDQPEPQPG
jgi:hypothetical protein